MKLEALLDIIGGSVTMKVVVNDFELTGTKDSMECLLSQDTLNYSIIETEPRSDVLWVWLK